MKTMEKRFFILPHIDPSFHKKSGFPAVILKSNYIKKLGFGLPLAVFKFILCHYLFRERYLLLDFNCILPYGLMYFF